jgi:hypothetical protein
LKRSIGVTLSAIATILGSVVLLLFAALLLSLLFLPMRVPEQTLFVRISWVIGALTFSLFAVWGIVTAIGLFRLRPWSRWSILIFSGMLAFIGAISIVPTALMQFPTPPGSPPHMMAIVKAVGIAFYLFVALIGAAWLWFFSTATTRAQFGSGVAPVSSSRRPLSVSLIALLLLFGALMCLVATFLPMPATVLGLVLTGPAARIVFLAMAAAQFALGVGLWRLNPLSRILTLVYLGFGAVNAVLYVVLPGLPARIAASVSFLPDELLRYSTYNLGPNLLVGLFAGLLFNGILFWLLLTRRPAFQH